MEVEEEDEDEDEEEEEEEEVLAISKDRRRLAGDPVTAFGRSRLSKLSLFRSLLKLLVPSAALPPHPPSSTSSRFVPRGKQYPDPTSSGANSPAASGTVATASTTTQHGATSSSSATALPATSNHTDMRTQHSLLSHPTRITTMTMTTMPYHAAALPSPTTTWPPASPTARFASSSFLPGSTCPP